jgi:hypothetical protein
MDPADLSIALVGTSLLNLKGWPIDWIIPIHDIFHLIEQHQIAFLDLSLFLFLKLLTIGINSVGHVRRLIQS